MLEGAKQEGTSDVAYSRNQPSVLEDDQEPRQIIARSTPIRARYSIVFAGKAGVPNGIRTRVLALKVRKTRKRRSGFCAEIDASRDEPET